jgi:CheY-like chemotaxis protein
VASKDLDTRLLLAHHLENLGYCIWTASCGADAYQIGIEHPVSIDVLLCDESFSDLPAPELYSRLKKRLSGLRCCVLATTRQQLQAEEAARLGATILNIARSRHTTSEPHELVPAGHAW